MKIRIYSYQNLASNEYPNIFVSNKLIRTNIRIYSYPKNEMNEYPNKYSDQKYSNIRIYSSHSASHKPGQFQTAGQIDQKPWVEFSLKVFQRFHTNQGKSSLLVKSNCWSLIDRKLPRVCHPSSRQAC